MTLDDVRLAEAAGVLDRAADRIGRGWTRGALARDAEGVPVSPYSPDACRWCMFGAVLAEANTVPAELLMLSAALMRDEVGGGSWAWNDGQWSASEVVAALRSASRRARSGQIGPAAGGALHGCRVLGAAA